ncbi:MBL fold metallo-hydrolase [Arthrobacter pigmenti]
MTTTLTLLGTAGGPTPKMSRSAPAQAINIDGQVFVIDCGNGVARQYTRAGLDFDHLDGVFITHHHSDHNADYGNLLMLAWGANLNHEVSTYGPPPLTSMTREFLSMNRVDIETRIADEGRPPLEPLINPREITKPGIVHQSDTVTVTAALVNHPPFEVALAYRFDTADRSIVISGDTAESSALIELAQGADILVHEVLYEPALDWILQRTNGTALKQHLLDSHTTVDRVGKVAQAANIKNLVLSHFVPTDAGITDETWKKEALQGFNGKVIVGSDLMTL